MVKYLGSVHVASNELLKTNNVRKVVFTHHSQFQKVHDIFSV